LPFDLISENVTTLVVQTNGNQESLRQGQKTSSESSRGTQPPGQPGTGSVRTRWLQLGVHPYVKIAILGGLLYMLFRGEVNSIVQRWFTDSSWSHGFLIPLFSLYFVNQRKTEILNLEYAEDPLLSLLRGKLPPPLRPGQTRPNYLGLVLMFFAIAFYVFNLLSASGFLYFRRIAIIATIGSVVLFLGGWRLVKYVWLPIGFLIFAVPLPDRYYVSLTMPMRRWAATVAAGLLNLIQHASFRAVGVVIEIDQGSGWQRALDVAEACSGMRLLLAFLALGVAMAYLHYRPLWQRIVLLASTIPIAILCNIVRVTATGFIYVLIHPKYTQGLYHDLLGLAMLPLAFGFYGLLAWFMSNLFIEETQYPQEDIVVRRREPR